MSISPLILRAVWKATSRSGHVVLRRVSHRDQIDQWARTLSHARRHVERVILSETSGRLSMRSRLLWVVFFAVGSAIVFARGAQTQSSIALAGRITSAEEGPMEGVLVSAKKAGSTITVTVVSDEQGRYRFPSAKLPPGQYAL